MLPLFLLKNVDFGYSLELPHQGDSNESQQSMLKAEMWKKYQNVYQIIFLFGWQKFSNIFVKVCFRNVY